MLNFGAFIPFIGVNAAALVHYKFRSKEKVAFPFYNSSARYSSVWLCLD
jgi:hypothetical protein